MTITPQRPGQPRPAATAASPAPLAAGSAAHHPLSRAAEPPTRPHGTSARYLHGPDQNDQPGTGCRCARCRLANTRTVNQRRHAIDTGRHQPNVDADPVRAHINQLNKAGLSNLQIAALAGVARDTINNLLHGRTDRPPTRRMRPDRAAAILAVRPDKDVTRGLTPAFGSRRRLHALSAVGWPIREVAKRAQLGPHALSEISRGASQQVELATARKIREIYDALWNVDPAGAGLSPRSVRQAKEHAFAHRWAPPMGWDDEDLDRPEGRPRAWARRDGAE